MELNMVDGRARRDKSGRARRDKSALWLVRPGGLQVRRG